MPKYKVNEGRAVKSGPGVEHVAGDTLELSENEAAGLVENGTVTLVQAVPAPKAQLPKTDSRIGDKLST